MGVNLSGKARGYFIISCAKTSAFFSLISSLIFSTSCTAIREVNLSRKHPLCAQVWRDGGMRKDGQSRCQFCFCGKLVLHLYKGNQRIQNLLTSSGNIFLQISLFTRLKFTKGVLYVESIKR
jgi:hypothetical protein